MIQAILKIPKDKNLYFYTKIPKKVQTRFLLFPQLKPKSIFDYLIELVGI